MPVSEQRRAEFEGEVARRTERYIKSAHAEDPTIPFPMEHERDIRNDFAWEIVHETGWEDVLADWQAGGFYEAEKFEREERAVHSLERWKLWVAVLDARRQAPVIRSEMAKLIEETASKLPADLVPADPTREDVDRLFRQLAQEARELEEFVRTDGASFMAGTRKEDCAKLAELKILSAGIMEEVWGKAEFERIWALQGAYGKALEHAIEKRREKRRARKH